MAELALTPVFPASHLWFLQALLAYTLTVPLLQRMPALASVALAGAVSFSVGFSGTQLEGDALGIFAPQRALYIWFALGYILSGRTITTVARLSGTERVSLGLAGLSILVALAPRLIAYRYLPPSLPIAALGIASVIMPVSVLRSDNPIQIFLALVGQYALEIYVLHIGIISAVRQLLDRTGLFGPGELFVECLIVSTVVSLAVAVAVRRTPARRLFYWTDPKQPRQLVSS